ncbi:MAG: hypothetical protein HY040_15470 [Planctomycetes bacterium]|nr:hypothetical protein [Planctomycetota bacterium]
MANSLSFLDANCSRREALSWTAAIAVAHASGLVGSGWTAPAQQRTSDSEGERGRDACRVPRIQRLRLKTHVLGEIRRFYEETMGLPVVFQSRRKAIFNAGATRLEFEQVSDGTEPYYHFAFNIPENKIEPAKDWLGRRARILRDARNGNDIIFFRNWNAHSLFFHDPAGNLVELIARHTLQNRADGGFGVRDILHASEIGLVPQDQRGVFAAIRERLGIEPYLRSDSFLGDEHGLIIVIPANVRWIPEFRRTGMLCPTQITVAGHGNRTLRFSDLPFQIVSQS